MKLCWRLSRRRPGSSARTGTPWRPRRSRLILSGYNDYNDDDNDDDDDDDDDDVPVRVLGALLRRPLHPQHRAGPRHRGERSGPATLQSMLSLSFWKN